MTNDNFGGDMSPIDQSVAANALGVADALQKAGVPIETIVSAFMTTAIELMATHAGEQGMKQWLAASAAGVIGKPYQKAGE